MAISPRVFTELELAHYGALYYLRTRVHCITYALGCTVLLMHVCIGLLVPQPLDCLVVKAK